jgi:hypothetical protein
VPPARCRPPGAARPDCPPPERPLFPPVEAIVAGAVILGYKRHCPE